MSKNIRNESTDGLFQAILSLQDMDECYTFFEDVCTINEIQSPVSYTHLTLPTILLV